MRSVTSVMKLFAALALAAATAAYATPPFISVVLPVYTAPTPGAFGSLWVSEVMVHNPEAFPATLVVCPDTCSEIAVPPGSHIDLLTPYAAAPGQPPGLLLGVYSQSSLSVTSRVRDVSRTALSLGVELPAIRLGGGDTVFFKKELLNVPLQPPFRYKLRFYDVNGGPRLLHVRIADVEAGDDVLQTDVQLSLARSIGYGELNPFSSDILSQRAGHHVRVEITAADVYNLNSLWAFVTITNNDTQEVTVVTPAQ